MNERTTTGRRRRTEGHQILVAFIIAGIVCVPIFGTMLTCDGDLFNGPPEWLEPVCDAL